MSPGVPFHHRRQVTALSCDLQIGHIAYPHLVYGGHILLIDVVVRATKCCLIVAERRLWVLEQARIPCSRMMRSTRRCFLAPQGLENTGAAIALVTCVVSIQNL